MFFMWSACREEGEYWEVWMSRRISSGEANGCGLRQILVSAFDAAKAAIRLYSGFGCEIGFT